MKILHFLFLPSLIKGEGAQCQKLKTASYFGGGLCLGIPHVPFLEARTP